MTVDDPDAGRAAPWRVVVAGGVVSFAWLSAAALGIGALEWIGTGRPFGIRLVWKLAGLYVASVHGAGLRLVTDGPSGSPTDGLGDLGPELTARITFLLGSAFAATLLWRAGRRAARASGGGRLRRVAWGASVAPAYAGLVWGLSQLSVLRFPDGWVVQARPLAVEALLGALALGAAAGAAGGAAESVAAAPPSSARGRRAVAWVAGGWRMTVALTVLSFAAFLVVAGLRADISATYVRGLLGAGTPGAIAATHHAMLVANQSFFIAAASMGGCVTVDGSGSQPSTICLRSVTVRPGWGSAVAPGLSGRTVAVPSVWLLLLAVPLAATVWGGRAAAAGEGSRLELAIRGAGAGVIFAALVLVAEAASAISVERPPEGAVVRLGADLLPTGVLALAWGVAGGTVGALLPGPRQEPAGDVSPPEPEPEEPPRATSL